jgi:hypothetical protein
MYNKGSFLALTTALARDKIAQDSVQLLPQPVTFDYEIHRFRGNTLVISGEFPDLNLTAMQVLSAG